MAGITNCPYHSIVLCKKDYKLLHCTNCEYGASRAWEHEEEVPHILSAVLSVRVLEEEVDDGS